MSITESPAVGGSVNGGGLIRGYVNGESVGSVVMEAPHQSRGQGSRDPHGFMQCTYNVATPSNGGLRVQLAGTTIASSPSEHGRGMKQPALNNTVFQVMGTSGGGIIGTPGMVQDLTLISNKVLPDDSVRDLAKLRPPVPLPTLDRLLVKYGVLGNVGNVCVVDLGGGQAAASTPSILIGADKDEMAFIRKKQQREAELAQHMAHPTHGAGFAYFSFYFWQAKSWRVCPPSVCGPISLNPHFLLSISNETPYLERIKDTCKLRKDGSTSCLIKNTGKAEYGDTFKNPTYITREQMAAWQGLKTHEVLIEFDGGMGFHTRAANSRVEPRDYALQRHSYSFHNISEAAEQASNSKGALQDMQYSVLGAGTYVKASVTWLVVRAQYYSAFYVQQLHAIVHDWHEALGQPREHTREKSQEELDELNNAAQGAQKISAHDDEDDGMDDVDAAAAAGAALHDPRKYHEHVVMDLYDSAMLWLHGSPFVRQTKEKGSPLWDLHALDDMYDDALISDSYPFSSVLARPADQDGANKAGTCTASGTCTSADMGAFTEDSGPTVHVPHPHPRQLSSAALLRQRRYSYEKAFSALALAMWLGHDNQALHPAGPKTWWSFRYAPPMMQPLQMALAHKLWWDPAEATSVQLPADLGAYLKDSLQLGLEVMDLVHGGNSADRAAQQREKIKEKNWERWAPTGPAYTPGSPIAKIVAPKEGWDSLIPGNSEDAQDTSPTAPSDNSAGDSENFNKVFDEKQELDARFKEIELLEFNLPGHPEKPRSFGATSMEEARGQMQAQAKYEEALKGRQDQVEFIEGVKKEYLRDKQIVEEKRQQFEDAGQSPNPHAGVTDLAAQKEEKKKLRKNWFDVIASLEGRAYSTATFAGAAAEAAGAVGASETSAKLIPELAALEQAGMLPAVLPRPARLSSSTKEANSSLHTYLQVRDGQSIPVDTSSSAPVSSVFSADAAYYKNIYKLINEEDTFNTPRVQKQIHSALLQAGQCRAAAAHLFPVASYVSSHYGQVGTGVAAMEDVRISSSDLDQQAGTETDEHHFYVQEAQEGDENAMLYLARRYFWGQGGVRADPERARHWYVT